MHPALRPDIEPVPVNVEGERLIALRDPEELTPETAMVQPGALPVLEYFDGANSVEDIRVNLAQRGAGFIGIDEIQALADALDRCFLLDNDRYRLELERLTEAFAATTVRPARHAGAAYPEDADGARAFMQEMLDAAGAAEPKPLARLVTPHIDLRLGADVHGHAHQRLRAAGRPDVVVILGVCHAHSEARFILCRKDFETPLGTVPHDAAFATALESRLGKLTHEQLLHKNEHSIEFQALWLAHLWPDDPPAIVPILLGSFQDFVLRRDSPRDDEAVEAFIAALRETIDADKRRVVVLASVDLAHLGPQYGQREGLDQAGEEAMETADRALLRHVEDGDAESFFDGIARDENARNVCGLAPIYVTLRLGGGGGELVQYGQGRIDPDTGSVVSFAALAFES